MDERLYRTLKAVAVVLGVGWIGWAFYDAFLAGEQSSYRELETANRSFTDGNYQRALAEYEAILAGRPDDLFALRGAARSLMQLSRNDEALAAFDQAIAADPQFAAAYANRGILNDRMGNYEAAIRDYERAAELDAELDEGPHWLTRFLRNQPEGQATILERARYLRAQLALPQEQRLLRVPEIDAGQRPYDR